MNAPSETAPSRAGVLPLVGNELALDFINTSSGRGGTKHLEHLLRPEHVVLWARHANFLPTSDGEAVERAVAADAKLSARLFKRAIELREAIHAICSALATSMAPQAAEVDRLRRSHAECVACARLAPIGAAFVWSWDPAGSPVEAILGPITLSALTLLTQADLSRVKQCRGDHCGWIFFDTTKNKSRRWCEMEVCGNRAKQRRLQGRRRSEATPGA
jgi:predicted RNA-binding Zn ribbon-like protein